MNPIAGRPPPTYKFGPDPEFWRSFTRSTQPSTDDAASDPGRRLRGQKLTCSGRCVTFGASANSTKAPKRILADQLLSALEESCSSRKPALSGAPLLKSFATQASVWPACKPIAPDNQHSQPNAGYQVDSERVSVSQYNVWSQRALTSKLRETLPVSIHGKSNAV